MNIKTTIGTLGAALALMTAEAMAGDAATISIYGKRPSWDADKAATEACLQQFVDRILPDHSHRVRVVATGPQVFGPRNFGAQMNVLMEARLASSGETFATGSCTVDRQASVRRLTTSVTQPQRLAGLSARDLVLTAQR